MHILLRAFPDAHGGAALSREIVIIGIGNTYRRDDGVGLAVADAIERRGVPGVRVVTDIADPLGLVDAWTGAALAVIVDAVVLSPSVPGRVHRCGADEIGVEPKVSSHAVNVGQALRLGRQLGRVPDNVAIFGVEVLHTDHGVGMSEEVSAAVADVVSLVLTEIAGARQELGS